MRYVQLRAFHNVAVHGGFSRAAEALHLTQPAISDQVRKLENEYDVLLFDRSQKQVSLTDAGRRLLDITDRLFEVESEAHDLLSESRALRSGRLSIVADAAHHVTHVLAAFRERYPGVEICMSAGNTQTALSDLVSYDADIAVLGEPPTSNDYETIRLGASPLVAFSAVATPFPISERATMAELASQPLVLRETGSRTRAKVEARAAEESIALSSLIEAEGREAVREIVAAGAGIGFVSEAEFGHDPRLRKIRIMGAPMIMVEALSCLRARQNTRLIRAFMAMARDHII